MRKIYRAIALVILLGTLLSFAVGCKKGAEEKIYGHCEVQIDLPPSFVDHDTGGIYDVAYSDGSVVVGILRLSFEAMESEGVSTAMSPSLFADRYYRTVALEGITASETVTDGDVVYYTYKLPIELGKSYTYMPTFYFTPYAYIVITYITPSEIFEAKKPTILEYARTFKIVDPNISPAK